jgi:hypothetical protein
VRGQRHAPAALYPGKDPVPIVQEAGWAPGLVWMGAENLALTGIRSPDRPACSQSLYQLRYPAHINFLGGSTNKQTQVYILSAAICVLRGKLDNAMYVRPRLKRYENLVSL